MTGTWPDCPPRSAWRALTGALALSLLASCASMGGGAMIHADEGRSAAYYDYLRGMLSERRGDYPDAIAWFEKAARHDPELIQAYRRLAFLRLRLGAIEMARAAAERAVTIDPGYVPCLNILAGIALSTGKSGGAAAYFERILAVDPQNQDAWVGLVRSQLDQGLREAALETLGRFEAALPGDPEGRFYRGRTLALLSRWNEAQEELEKLIGERPDYFRAYDHLAWTYIMQGDLDAAQKLYERQIAIHPGDAATQAKLDRLRKALGGPEARQAFVEGVKGAGPGDDNFHLRRALDSWRMAELTGDPTYYHTALDFMQLARAGGPGDTQIPFYIANIFERMGMLNEAVATWKQITLPGDAANRDIQLKIAELYERSGDPRESLKHAIAATRLDPRDAELRYFAGLLYNKVGDSQRAAGAFKEAIALKADEDKYYFYLGVVYEKLGRYDDCIAAMKKAVELKPDHSNALNYLGYIYAVRDVSLEEAERYLRQAIALEPENGYFIDSLGWIFYKQRRYQEALDQLLAAVRNIPPDPVVLEHLGDVHAALEQPTLAADAYERSLSAQPEPGAAVPDRDAVRRKLEDVRKRMEAAPSPAEPRSH